MNNRVTSYPLAILGMLLFALGGYLLWIGFSPFVTAEFEGPVTLAQSQTVLYGSLGLCVGGAIVESARAEPRNWCFWLAGLGALMNIGTVIYLMNTT